MDTIWLIGTGLLIGGLIGFAIGWEVAFRQCQARKNAAWRDHGFDDYVELGRLRYETQRTRPNGDELDRLLTDMLAETRRRWDERP